MREPTRLGLARLVAVNNLGPARYGGRASEGALSALASPTWDTTTNSSIANGQHQLGSA